MVIEEGRVCMPTHVGGGAGLAFTGMLGRRLVEEVADTREHRAIAGSTARQRERQAERQRHGSQTDAKHR